MKIKTNLPRRVICIGLGPIGIETCKLIVETPQLALAGVVDKDAQKVGKALAQFVPGAKHLGLKVQSDLDYVLRKIKPSIAFLTTSSQFLAVIPDIKTAILAGTDIVSSCEEMAFPWLRHSTEAYALDQFIKEQKGKAVGTGVNPGFVMDFLPSALATVCQRVDSILVRRIVDVSQRRLQLQKKMCVGLNKQEFQQLLSQGKVGHVGLKESLALIANAMGWKLDVAETIAPLLAKTTMRTPHFKVMPGQVIGIAQTATGSAKGKPKLVLELSMSIGAKKPADEIHIQGVPPVHMTIAPGIQGDLATAACLVHAALRLERSRYGLLTVTDLSLR